MYMDNIKPNEKIGNPNIVSGNIHLGHRDGIRLGKMCHANNEKRETTHDGRNRTTKPRKDQNPRRKGNLQILGDIESGHHQTNGVEGKKFKIWSQETRKLLKIKLYSRNLIKVSPLSDIGKRTREELKIMDRRTRKRMTMHPRNDENRLYV